MEKELLKLLLDKYEKSRHATGEARIRRRVTVKTSELSGYHQRDIEYRKSLHRAALHLEQAGVLAIEWVPGETGNLIQALHLTLEKVAEAYRIAEEKPSANTREELGRRLANLELQLPWGRAFVQDCLNAIQEKQRYPAQLPREPQKLDLLLRTLAGLEDKGSEEMLERIFSKRYLGNSKIFEQQVRRRLTGILRRYGEEPTLEEEDLLAEVGLVRSSSELLICGPLQLTMQGKLADLTPFAFGIGLGAETLESSKISSCNCSTVVSVENKATFRELTRAGLPAGVLLICLGGFAGPVKRRFMGKLNRFLDGSVPCYHWGDLDYGGILIFQHLRRTCIPGLQPLLMETGIYRDFSHLGEDYDETYRVKLQTLLLDDTLGIFHELLGIMLQEGRTLEQEAVPVTRLWNRINL